MKLFISWSGEAAKEIGAVLHRWLPQVMQAVKPYYTPDDIAKGARWGTEIGRELEASRVGILIVTQECLTAPWLMFEAGALSKNIGRTKVAPILFGVEPADLPGPLVQFQSANFTKADIKRVLRMINSELADGSLADDVLEKAFEMWWPSLEKEVQQILKGSRSPRGRPQRSERELLEEILELTRSMVPAALVGLDAVATSAKESTPAEEWTGQLSLQAIQERLAEGGNLSGANLVDLDLSGLDLSGANLRGANLVGAYLRGTSLVGTNLEGANLERADLDGADLSRANISRTNLWRASMKGVRHLSGVKSMEHANFYEVRLDKSDREVVEQHATVSLGNYPQFFRFYREQGMSDVDLRDLFLWTAHSYPGVDISGM